MKIFNANFFTKLLNPVLLTGIAITLLTNGCHNKLANNSPVGTVISFSSQNIVYQGRIDASGQSAVFYWPGTSAKIFVKGQGSVSVCLKDEKGKNYYNIILDNHLAGILHPDTTKQYYLLAANLSEGKHSIEIFKRTEWSEGNTRFYGFRLKGTLQLVRPPDGKRLSLEFYGNSITAGYAVDDAPSHSHPDNVFTNNYDSYAYITARYFNANYRCICKSGIGIMVSWFPLIMPEMYDRLNPSDSASRWDFSKYIPDIAIINLFQNDSWIVHQPEFIEFKKRFGSTPPSPQFIVNAYKQFVLKIRQHYPKAQIICMLGNMDITRKGSPWPGYVQQAVKQLNDKKIHTLFIPYKKTPGHPGKMEQQILADSLIRIIKILEPSR